MRIGIDASRAFTDMPTGTERYAYEIITRMLNLPEAGKHEWVLYLKKSQSSRVAIKQPNVRLVEIRLPYLWTQAGLAVRTWVDKLDVLWIPAHTLPVLRKPGLTTAVTIHGIEYEWLPAYENRLQRWYLPWSTIYAVRTADKVISVSEFTKKQLIVRLNGDQNKIKMIREGYDPENQNHKVKTEKDVPRILNKYKLKSKKYILFVGTVQPRKNLERLIEAFAGLETKELKLIIAGKLGWKYEGVVNAPKKFGVEDRVVITGYIDDYTRQIMLENALMSVQPSVTEGFGLPVLEAMFAGVPVVSSNGGALPEAVGDAGLLFNPNDTKQITAVIQKMVNNGKLRRTFSELGKERINNFSWENAAIETYKYLTD